MIILKCMDEYGVILGRPLISDYLRHPIYALRVRKIAIYLKKRKLEVLERLQILDEKEIE